MRLHGHVHPEFWPVARALARQLGRRRRGGAAVFLLTEKGVEDFQKDPRPHKINLSIGIYFDDAGRIPVLESVKRAEAQVLAAGGPKPYLPIEGAANFRSAVQALLFGAEHEAVKSARIATIQSWVPRAG